MRVLVTGSSGFVGRWLCRELEGAGHVVVGAPPSADLDIGDANGVRELVRAAAPDAIAHLAGTASIGTAERDAGRAARTMIGGTVAVMEAAGAAPSTPSVLLVSSAEVYAPPHDEQQPLTEASPLVPRHAYGLLKLAAESVAICAAQRSGVRLVVVRPFGHVGPGQRPVSAVAAFAARVAAVARGESSVVAVGNLDVERDIGDVRDYVKAYRLLIEQMADGPPGAPPAIYNLATGRAHSLRWILEQLCALAGVTPEIRVDPGLVRSDEPRRLVGDPSLLQGAVAWQPGRRLETTLADVLAEHLDPA